MVENSLTFSGEVATKEMRKEEREKERERERKEDWKMRGGKSKGIYSW